MLWSQVLPLQYATDFVRLSCVFYSALGAVMGSIHSLRGTMICDVVISQIGVFPDAKLVY